MFKIVISSKINTVLTNYGNIFNTLLDHNSDCTPRSELDSVNLYRQINSRWQFHQKHRNSV